MTDLVSRNVIYDKFLLIEGWAYRGKSMVQAGLREKATEALRRIHRELKELDALMKYNEPEMENKPDHL